MGNVIGQYGTAGEEKGFAYGLGLEGSCSADGWAYYDFDAIGSTSGVTGVAGAYVDQYAYDPFGGTLLANETVENSFEFVGAYGVTVDGSGLTCMRARFYSPEEGRFAAVDPLGLMSGDVNSYRYAFNNPNSLIDPLGLSAWNEGFGGAPCAQPLPPARLDEIFRRILGPGGPGPRNNPLPDNFDNDDSSRPWKRPPTGMPEPEDPFKAVPPVYIPGLPPYLGLSGGAAGAGGGGSGVGGGGSGPGCFPPGPPPNEPPPVPPSNPCVASTGDDTFALSDSGPTCSPNPPPPNVPPVIDPNEKLGANGFGAESFVPVESIIPYHVKFENLGPGTVPTPAHPATAPAQRVVVTDQLSTNFDWSTLRFTEAGFGDTVVDVPAAGSYFFTTVPMTWNGVFFEVEVELSFDSSTGQVRAVFQSIDPTTSLPPDVLTGFLPPEDGTGIGQGYFGYTIQPKAGLPTGTQIRNVAVISFDDQETIATNQVDPQDPSKGTDPTKEALNTIDAGLPTSSVQALPDQSVRDFVVAWSGTDDAGGSGINSYHVYVADNGGQFTLWLDDTTDTSATYHGQSGHTYSFLSIATDNVGHHQATPAAAQASTMVSLNPTVELTHRVTTLDENTSTASRIKMAGIVAAHAGQGSSLSLSGADASRFEIEGSELFLKTGTVLDFEAKRSYSVTVSLNDSAGAADDSADFTLDITDVNESPTAVEFTHATTSLMENSNTSSRVKVADLDVIDDGLGTNVLTLSGADAALFEIVGTQLFIRSGSRLDFETNPVLDVNVDVNDAAVGGDPDATRAFSIQLIDVAESATVIGGFSGSLNFKENGAAILLDSSVTVTDADSPNFAFGKLTIAITQNGDAGDRLTIRNQGTGSGQIDISGSNVTFGGTLIGTFSGGQGNSALTVSLNEACTQAALRGLIQNLLYANSSDGPSTGTKRVEVRVRGGDGMLSAPVSKTITVKAVNDRPVVGAFDGTVTFTAGEGPMILDGDATVIDPDSPNLQGGKLTIKLSRNGNADDRLGIRSEGMNAGQIGVSGFNVTFGGTIIGTFTGGVGTKALIITFNASSTPAAVQALLRNITFNNVSSTPTMLTHTVQATLTDGDGGTSATVSKTISFATASATAAFAQHTALTSIETPQQFAAPVASTPVLDSLDELQETLASRSLRGLLNGVRTLLRHALSSL